MLTTFRFLLVLSFAISLIGSAAANEPVPIPARHLPGNLLVNGDFHDIPPDAGDHGTPIKPGSTAIAGWIVSGGQVSTEHNHENCFVNLNEAGTLSQVVNTEPGQTYQLSFLLSGVGFGPKVKKLAIHFGDELKVVEFDASKTYKEEGPDWLEKLSRDCFPLYSYTFQATSRSTRLEFKSLVNDWHGPLLADVMLVPWKASDIQRSQFEPLYQGLGGTIPRKDHRYVEFLLLPDFTARRPDGQAVPRDQYLSNLQALTEGKSGLRVQYKLTKVSGDDKTIAADVERTVSYTSRDSSGDEHRYVIVTQLHDT